MWTPAGGTSADGTRWGPSVRSSRAPWHQEGLQRIQRSAQLVTLHGTGGIDILRTDLSAFSHEGATPNAFVLGKDLESFARAFVARVEVVSLGEGNGRRPDELLVQAVDRAGSVTQHAVDAHAELHVVVHLLRRLPVFAIGQRFVVLADDPGFHPAQFSHEVADLDDEIA